MTKIRSPAVILDLDDTLYLERDYVLSGFNAVEAYVSQTRQVTGFGSRCWSLFEQGVRGTTFNQVLAEMGLAADLDAGQLVRVYRSHAPSITLAADAVTFLEAWPAHRALGLITDGPVDSQSAKIAALDLKERLYPIIMSDEFGIQFRKPHDRAFEEVERLLGLSSTDLTYIADNPRKDFLAPRRRGWHTIRVRRPLGEHSRREDPSDCPADSEIVSFDELAW